MKIKINLLIFVFTLASFGQESTSTIKSMLLEQLKNTHTEQAWFVPINIAVKGLTAEQAGQKEGADNHSIAELISHLIFWNERELMAFQGYALPEFENVNETTFQQFKELDWFLAIKRLDSIQTLWTQEVQQANEEELRKWSSEIANMCSHNAYHTGQIVYIRKQNGWWH